LSHLLNGNIRHRAEQLVFTAAAATADLERQIAQQEPYISVLLG
jgi:hypothetical protein